MKEAFHVDPDPSAVVLLLAFTLITGIAYPLAVTGIAQRSPRRRQRLLLVRDGKVVGSALIGQKTEGALFPFPARRRRGWAMTPPIPPGAISPDLAELKERITADVASLREGGLPGPSRRTR